MTDLRLDDYLEHIESAARRALEFVGQQSRDDFLEDIKTQHAVALSFAVMGEAATRTVASYPDFTASTPEIGWREVRGMRPHLVHGYFSIDYEIVWDTVHSKLPRLLVDMARLRAALSSDDS